MQRPWFRRQTWSWYVESDEGKQHNLGRHPSDVAPRKGKRGWSPPPGIEQEWRALCARLEAGSPRAAGPSQDMPVAELCHRFLPATKGQMGEGQRENYRYYLQDFLGRHPGLTVAGITRELVRAWLDADDGRSWGVSSHRAAITALKRALNWGVEWQLLVYNPIAKLKKPKARVRKKVLDSAERAAVRGLWPEGDCFRDFLTAIEESGCRPGEVMGVTAAHFDDKAATWTFRSKDFEATGEMRVVYLTPRLRELSRRLAAEHPSGPLFRNAHGNPWKRHAVSNRLNRKKNRKKDPIDKGVVAYAYRHSYITDAIANGVPEKLVAELVGHRSTAMISRYAHLDTKDDLMLRAAQDAVRASAARPRATPTGDGEEAASSGATGSRSP